MASKRPLYRPKCGTHGCREYATAEVLNQHGERAGVYCEIHATSKLVSLDMYEEAFRGVLHQKAPTNER